MDCSYISDRISVIKDQILAYEAAIEALVISGVSEYDLDTGMTVQRVKKHNLPGLNKAIDMLLNRLEVLCARCPQSLGQAGSFIAHPVRSHRRGAY